MAPRHFLIAAVVVLAFAALVAADQCGGNCPYDCPWCACGYNKNAIDIDQACWGFQGWNHDTCKCIANAESSGNGNAVHYNQGDNTYDVGLWQIDSVNWASCNNGNTPCDQWQNLNCAIDIWRWGGGFSAWATCGGCNACGSTDSAVHINPEWDGSWPEWYDASRPFPSWAVNSTDARLAESLDYVMPSKRNGQSKPRKITLKEE